MSVKSKLLAKNRKTAKTLIIEGEEVQLIKPTVGDRLKVMEAAQQAGELDAEGNASSVRSSIRSAARLIVALTYKDGHPLFSAEDIDSLIDVPWFDEVAKECGAVFNPDEAKLKNA